jgi:oligoribonuclease NrnB/cAMP/cGMP phosphodiesterase (DHH superfamily)
METMNKICIYHGNCADGFGAAWVVRKALGEHNVDFHKGIYGEAPPDVEGREVVMVDFSYKRHVLLEMAAKAKSILILDHHKTAQDDLIDLPDNVVCVFDMTRSGVMLAWDYFFPQETPPMLIHHIQDRDLWLFKLDGTREIQANVFSYPYDFKIWDELMTKDCQILRVEGAAIERKHHKDISELVSVTKRTMKIGGHIVPVANLPYTLSSDAGHLMDEGVPFAACYYDTPKARCFSLRSAEKGEDVALIAKAYGGGGHKHAAGFSVPLGWEGDNDNR